MKAKELNQLTRTLSKLADWKDSLEMRLKLANALLQKGLPDPGFVFLETECAQFRRSCENIVKRLHDQRA